MLKLPSSSRKISCESSDSRACTRATAAATVFGVAAVVTAVVAEHEI
jgi:hypothetical protein